jgi:hypothetical protein
MSGTLPTKKIFGCNFFLDQIFRISVLFCVRKQRYVRRSLKPKKISYVKMTYATIQAPQPSSLSSSGDLTRIFNTALIATRSESRDFSAELFALVETPAFQCVLESVRTLAKRENISEREAAETVIQTFRNVDRLWGEYIYQEGVERLKRQPH